MNGLETIVKMNKVPKGTKIEVYAHCVEFFCPRCGGHACGEGYVTHNKKGEPLVKCFNCGFEAKAVLMPL